MGTIFEYLEDYGRYSFFQIPFNEVDALILSQFSYLKLEGIVAPIERITYLISVEEIVQSKYSQHTYRQIFFEKKQKLLLEKMANSRRFSRMKCVAYANWISKESESQFAALTCILEDSSVKIIFRGTDENLVGWKEDLNMTYMFPVPSQEYSRIYLEKLTRLVPGQLDVIGHSKGGNLAVYSAMLLGKDLQERICHIYNFDGPGFRKGTQGSAKYQSISHKVKKYIPKKSMVGLLLESETDYVVVESKSRGWMQHSGLTWQIVGESICRSKRVPKEHYFFQKNINLWLQSLDENELREVANSLYQIVESSNSDNVIDLLDDWKKYLPIMIQEIRQLEEEKKTMVATMLKRLILPK